MREYIISENDSGQRLDKFLCKALPHLPKSLFYKWLRTKHIKVNRRKCDAAYKLCPGDRIQLFIPDENFAEQKQTAQPDFLEAPNTLDILYEDENLLIVEKPAGLVVHTDERQVSDCLVNRVRRYLYEKGSYDPAQEQSFSPALCNRLDRNTSGIVIAAKTAAALREVNRLIRENCLEKVYLCEAVGRLPAPADTLHAWHMKQAAHNTVTITDTPAPGSREIITKYRVIAEANQTSLVEITLITGRTHQIRAHLAHIGAPVVGDGKYGEPVFNKRHRIFHQQLHAFRLIFHVPQGSPLAYLDGKAVETAPPDFAKKFLT